MKKLSILLVGMFSLFLASCKDGKLPWASIQGATLIDYLPILLIIFGVVVLAIAGIDQLKNGKAYLDKKKNPAVIRFWAVGAVIAIVFAVLWIITA